MNQQIKTLAIWGLGREGKAVFDQRKELFPSLEKLLLIDESTQELPSEWVKNNTATAKTQIQIQVHEPHILESTKIDLLIRSAGVSPYKKEIQQFKKNGNTVKSVSTLWFEQQAKSNLKTVCITGTKGKSTTSKLVWHLLNQMGINAVLGGNIGVPLLELPTNADWYIIEMSSYQSSDFEGCPDLGVVLNLFEDHTSWHGSVQQYHKDKLNLLNQSSQGLIGHQVSTHPAYTTSSATTQPVEIVKNVTSWQSEITNNELTPHNNILNLEDFSLKGTHNAQNLLSALTIVEKICTLSQPSYLFKPKEIETWRHLLKNYKPLPYRLEEVGTKNGKIYVCDPLSTNASSTIASLQAYQDKKVALLLGGLDRQQDLSELIDYLNTQLHIVAVIGLPETGWSIADQTGGQQVQNLIEGVQKAQSINSAEVILFSPAAASLSTGETYQTRGEIFKSTLLDL